MKKEIKQAYMICTIQRSGSGLLSQSLKNTNLAGYPEEHFLNGEYENGGWAKSQGISSRPEFLEHILQLGTSANGVFGTKMMWNYFPAAISGLQALPEYTGLEAYSLLQKLLPKLKFIWLVRQNKVRQAVSWTLAAQTGIYSAEQAKTQKPLREPVFDFEQIDGLYNYIFTCEAGWLAFFANNGISPLKVVYEEFVQDYEGTALRILDFLEVDVPAGYTFTPRKIQSQSTSLNTEWAEQFRRLKWGENA